MKITIDLDEETSNELAKLHTLYLKCSPRKVSFSSFSRHILKVCVQQNCNQIKSKIYDMIEDSEEDRRKILEKVQWENVDEQAEQPTFYK